MLIEIRGTQFVNKGAELMLRAILERIRLKWPNAEIAMLPNKNCPFILRAEIPAYQRVSLRKGFFEFDFLSYFIPLTFRSWLKSRLGFVFEADIDIVLDASGFAYGDQWSDRSALQLSNEIVRFKKNNKKYILMPQALGPFSSKPVRKSLALALPSATIIFAREDESFSNVADLIGEAGNLIKSPDFTNIIRGSAGSINNKSYGLIIPNGKMVSAKNTNIEWRNEYFKILCLSVEAMRKMGITPVILNHEGPADEGICQALAQEYKLEIFGDLNALEVKATILSAELIVCSRFHGCVSALTQAVPCLGTSWSHKYECLFDEYGKRDFLLSPSSTDRNIEKMMKDAIDEKNDVAYLASIDLYKELTYSMWNKVECEIDQYKSS